MRRSAEPLHQLVDSTGVKIHGEGEWKVKKHGPEYRCGYHRLSLVETAMHRFKRFGERLQACRPERQVAAVHVRCAILNRFVPLAMPKTVVHA